jgi:hypothetical protein
MPQGPLSNDPAISPGLVRVPLYEDAQGALYIQQRHGQGYGSSYLGGKFWAANQAGVTTSAGLATTYVGICLSNPASSGKNLAVGKVSAAIIVAPAAVLEINLIVGFAAGGVTVHTTPLTVYSELIGATAAAPNGTKVGTPVGLVDGAATLVGTPLYYMPLAVNAASAGLFSAWADLQGDLILPPGAYVAIGTNVAGPTSGFVGRIGWEELPQ